MYGDDDGVAAAMTVVMAAVVAVNGGGGFAEVALLTKAVDFAEVGAGGWFFQSLQELGSYSKRIDL